MNAEILLSSLTNCSSKEAIKFIGENRAPIRALFLRQWKSTDDKNTFEKIESKLYSIDFSPDEFKEVEIQALFVHLAYYFLRIGDLVNVSACLAKIVNPYFKLRLEAWKKTRRYQNYSEHITQLGSYLQLLTAAQDEVDDGNYNELLGDLDEYINYAHQHLSINYKREFDELISDFDLQDRYLILKQYNEKNTSEIPGLLVTSYDGREYEPSDFALDLFEEKFVSRIRRKSQPGFPKFLMGYPAEKIRDFVIGRGQANFDERFDQLDGGDRVNLYCYFNMRMHFFSSLSLLGRSNILDRFYNTSGKIKFIDIGCGPATSGLAFAEYIHQETGVESFFDYYGIDIAENMLVKADEMLTNTVFAESNEKLFFNNLTKLDFDRLEGASCVVINCCYVFASLSLPYIEIADYIRNLVAKHPYTPKYLLYQNVVQEAKNVNYQRFKYLLGSYSIEWTSKELIKYHTIQNSYYEPSQRVVYYEILRLS